MQRSVWIGVSLAAVIALVAMGAWLLARQGDEAFANPGIEVGIDTDPSGNTASSLGTIQRCISKNVTDPAFDVDLYVKDVTDLGGWDVTISYTESIVKPQNVTDAIILGWFMGTPTGLYYAADTEFGLVASAHNFPSGPWHSGSGVLVRINVKAMGNGVSPFNITLNNLDNKDLVSLKPQTTVYNGRIAVGEGCDFDNDGVADDQDKCPETYHPANTDVDGDGIPGTQPPPGATWGGDACDDSDGDQFTDLSELYLGTDRLDKCPDTTGDPAWPLDQDNNGQILIPDVSKYTGKLFTPVTCPSADPNCRLDLDTNGTILIPDVSKYTGKLFESCTQ